MAESSRMRSFAHGRICWLRRCLSLRWLWRLETFPAGRIPVGLRLRTGSGNPRPGSKGSRLTAVLGLLTLPSWLNLVRAFIFDLVDLVTGEVVPVKSMAFLVCFRVFVVCLCVLVLFVCFLFVCFSCLWAFGYRTTLSWWYFFWSLLFLELPV